MLSKEIRNFISSLVVFGIVSYFAIRNGRLTIEDALNYFIWFAVFVFLVSIALRFITGIWGSCGLRGKEK